MWPLYHMLHPSFLRPLVIDTCLLFRGIFLYVSRGDVGVIAAAGRGGGYV